MVPTRPVPNKARPMAHTQCWTFNVKNQQRGLQSYNSEVIIRPPQAHRVPKMSVQSCRARATEKTVPRERNVRQINAIHQQQNTSMVIWHMSIQHLVLREPAIRVQHVSTHNAKHSDMAHGNIALSTVIQVRVQATLTPCHNTNTRSSA